MVLPILVGASHLINSREKIVYNITAITSFVVFSIAIFLCINVFQTNEIHYYFGGWLPPVGIEFKITKLNSVFAVLISGVATLTFFQSKKMLFEEIDIKKVSSFCGVFLICLSGFLGMILTNDFFNLYVFIEISALASYSLVSVSSNKESLKAAFCYLIVGTIAATFILIGIGYLYSASGTLNIDDFIQILPRIENSRSVYLGYYLVLTGLIVKAGLFPLHTWFVQSYKSTSSFIIPFLTSTSSKIYIFLVIKIIYFIFGISFVFWKTNSHLVLGIMAVLSVMIGAIAAYSQTNLRYMLIFSSISQTGYMFIAISVGNEMALVSAIIFIIGNILAKTSLFLLASQIYLCRQGYELANLYNIKTQLPIVVTLFIINAASIIGVPSTIGFAAKLNLGISLIQADMWIMLGVVLASSFISIMYFWKFIEKFLYSDVSSRDVPSVHSDFSMGNRNYIIPCIALLTFLNLCCGIFFQTFFNFISGLII